MSWPRTDRSPNLVMTLFLPLLVFAALAANLNRQLFALGVAYELSGLLLDVLGGAGGLVDGPALLLARPVAHLKAPTPAT